MRKAVFCWNLFDCFCPTVSCAMGVKMLQCFPFYRRCKERCKSRQCPPDTGEGQLHSPTINGQKYWPWPLTSNLLTSSVPIEEMKPRLSSTTSWDSEGSGTLSRGPCYFSTKARLSFRHQLDSNINAVDATYWPDHNPAYFGNWSVMTLKEPRCGFTVDVDSGQRIHWDRLRTGFSIRVLDPNGPKKSDHNQDNTELFTSFITDKCIILDKAEKSGFESFKKKSFISEVVEVQADNPCGGWHSGPAFYTDQWK